MSDTDDTDLLLLIPPDFFLVRSDLDDFDCDSDIGIGHHELKDTIVSDLITQVNDLESRICQIESLERTSTRCSTCNDDSVVNQSIISLTESDVLRAQIKEHSGFSKNCLNNISFMVKSNKNENVNDSSFEVENGLAKELVHESLMRPKCAETSGGINFKDNIINVDCLGNSNADFDHQKINIQNKALGPESQLSKEKQTLLLNEVDSYLFGKQLNTVTSEYRKLPEENNRQKDVYAGHQLVNSSVNTNSVANEMPDTPKSIELENHEEDSTQSFALTEVYKLINEMEETQTEMQRKLNVNGTPRLFQLHDKDNDKTGANKHMKGLSQRMYSNSNKVLDLDDLSTKSPKLLFSNQTEDVTDKYKTEQNHNFESLDVYRLDKNPETNYLLTNLPSSSDGNPHQRTNKSISPNRGSVTTYNPIDIVRANLPGRKDDRSSQFGEGKDLSNKSSGFRRQLHFEKPLSPLRRSKSRTSMQIDQRLHNQSELRNKHENDRLSSAPLQRTSRSGKSSLEEKFNTLTLQRSNGTITRENQNLQFNVANKPSSEILQNKISSSNLLSLSELWNKEPTFYSDDPNKLRQKLEEERYRRQHCEQQIQALQLRVLEEQEKLAVAIRVDQEKDRAIMQITESWKKLNDHWNELEEQRHSLAQQLQAEKESAKIKNEELSKKAERWEKEVSQALDLAAGYKEKSEVVQNQMVSLKQDMDGKVHQLENQLQNQIEENEKLIKENKVVTEQLQSLQQRLQEEEDLLAKLKTELEKSRKRLSEFEAENSILKEQKSSLTTSIKEERNRMNILEQKLNSLQEAFNEACKKEQAAQDEVRMSQERLEVARTELRALYQGQLEAVVKEKLQEFQGQLEVAETALKAELHSKEKQWAEKANEQYRQLHDKYKRDLLRVEEIHKADVNSWKQKLLESERLRGVMEKKLQEEADRRADIAQRLHGVLETQWREALDIITNPMKALYEIPKDEHPRQWPQQQEDGPERLQAQGDMRASRSDSTASLGPVEEIPFGREGLVTYRTPKPSQDQQLKKYIQMLLEKGPGNLVQPQNSSLQESPEQQTMPPRNNALFDNWLTENEKKEAWQTERQNQCNKPPWR